MCFDTLPKLQCAATLQDSAAGKASPTPNGRVTCILIPGDGVGPEVLQSMEATIDFEKMHLSEVCCKLTNNFLSICALDPLRSKSLIRRCNGFC